MPNLLGMGMQFLTETAARRGVALDFRLLPASGLTGQEVAAAVQADLGQIVKSIVCLAPRPAGWGIPILCLVSGRNRLDLDLVAALTGELEIRETAEAEASELLGCPYGSVPPFGHGRGVRTVMDQSLVGYPWLWVSAGIDSAVFRIAPSALRALCNAIIAPVAQPSWMRPIGAIGSSPPTRATRLKGADRLRRLRAEEGP